MRELAGLGGYFAVETGPPEAGWRTLGDLLTGGDLIAARVDEVARRLGTGERRVAASILFQGLAARFWSPPIGLAVGHGLLLVLDPRTVLWRPVETGPLPLRLSAPATLPLSAEGLYAQVVDGLLEPLAATLRAVVPLSPHIVWGNAASAMAGSLRMLPRSRRALDLGAGLLRLGRLRETGRFAGEPFFVRRSCCLYYRIPGGGICGDCVLAQDGRTA
ncbi:hypothetical protein Aph01nite_19020 [Acrocarpospora phusangensis]|uniref:Ferric siderophore reductase C-terminal domain-containing protein n=1 Tax=Acrocarpospora phusangensis TaxID=1070424 RepID=A0A919QC38_9ACTN|nr:(2Fe-2S)-binding protein [Acrocarpospora phusangensis]GIH23592.1 hypothetical protein Aph01nite_19020 [Acrocarpospora phusangensis]